MTEQQFNRICQLLHDIKHAVESAGLTLWFVFILLALKGC